MKTKHKIKLIAFYFMLGASIIGYSQSNQYDDNQQKHGVWQENSITGEYSHGKKIGKWSYPNMTEEFDVNGVLIKQVLYYDNNPNFIKSIKEYKNGQIMRDELYIQIYARDVPKPARKFNYYYATDAGGSYSDFDGLQVEFKGDYKKEDLYDKGKLIESKVFYPNSNQAQVVTKFGEYNKFGGRKYTGIITKRTFFYENGSIFFEYDPSLFVDFSINGDLPYYWHFSVNKHEYDPSISIISNTQFSTLNKNPFRYGTNITYGEIDYKRKLDSVLVINVFDENAKSEKQIVFSLTDKTSDNFKVTQGYYHYGLHGTYNGKKYYKGLPDSIVTESAQDNGTVYLTRIMEYNKGVLRKSETYCCLSIGNTGDNFNVIQTNYDKDGVIDGSEKRYYLKRNTVTEKIYNHGKIKAEPPQTTGEFQSYFPNIYQMYALKTISTGNTREGFIYSDENENNKSGDSSKDKKKKKISFGDVMKVINE